jgi:hypothetical protein
MISGGVRGDSEDDGADGKAREREPMTVSFRGRWGGYLKEIELEVA